MKKYAISSLVFLCSILSACATKTYTQLEPLNDQHKENMTCEGIQAYIEQAQGVIHQIGEVSTTDKVMSGAGVGIAILRASLGGFNSEDWQPMANSKAQQEASDKAKLRLAQLEELHSVKGCVAPEKTVKSIEQAPADQALNESEQPLVP